MINYLKDAPSKKRALGPNKTSSKFSLSTITENPLDQTSISSDYPSDNLQLSLNIKTKLKTQTGLYLHLRFILNVLHVNYPKCQNMNSFQNVNPIPQSLLTTQNQSHNLCHILHYPSLPLHYPFITVIDDS